MSNNPRGFFYDALQAKEELYAKVADRIYPRGSLGIGDNPPAPETPYLMYAIGDGVSHTEVRDTVKSSTQSLRIYVYDRKGSYVQIDEIHRLVRETLEMLSGYDDGKNWRCTDIYHVSMGEETTDGTNNLRIATYRFTGRQ